MKRSVIFAACATLAIAGAVKAQEDGPFSAAIEARQGIMTFNALNLATLGGMAKGEIAYDAAAAQVAADNIAGTANLNLGVVWPKGSDNASVEGTRALPAIWADGSDIGAKSADFRAAAAAMQAAAGTDLAALQAAMGVLGGACGACHKAYRASE